MAWDVLTCHQKCQFFVATNRHGNRPEVLLQTPCFVARNKHVKRPEALLQTPCFVVASNTARNIPTSIKKKTFFFLHSVACNSTTIPSTCRRDVQRKGFWQIFACFQGEWRRERVYGGQTLVVYRTISWDRSVLGCVLHLGHPVTNLVDLSWKFGDKVLVLTFCWNVNTLRNIWHIQMWISVVLGSFKFQDCILATALKQHKLFRSCSVSQDPFYICFFTNRPHRY